MQPVEREAIGVADSRALLHGLRDLLGKVSDGQARLEQVTQMIAASFKTEVCSIYLLRDATTLELCASEGLSPSAVHVTRMRIGEGLVGRIAQRRQPINTADAPAEPGFRFMPETGEEVFSSFLGVPLLQRGEPLGVLVVQSKEAKEFSSAAIYDLEVVAAVLADMAELGSFVSDRHALTAPHTHPVQFSGGIGQEGIAEGNVLLHESRVVVTNPVADDPVDELKRLNAALDVLRIRVDEMASASQIYATQEHRAVIETYRMFANSRSWAERMATSIRSGLSAEAAVEKEQSDARSRMNKADAYLRDRLHDLDDLSNRLLRILTGQGQIESRQVPDNPVLVARQIGPGEMIEYGRGLKAVVLEEGSVGSHATIIARAMAIPLLVHVEGITNEALNGDPIVVDGDAGTVYLRPDESVAAAVHSKIEVRAAAQRRYLQVRDLPATTQDGVTIEMHMNAGLMADLPNLVKSGAEGVGLFRTELRFLAANRIPGRDELADQYALVIDSSRNKPVYFRTLDIGSDKVLPFFKPEDEPNPAMGWRGIRITLDRPIFLTMQLQALIRGARGRPLSVMFPMVAEAAEFNRAREIFLEVIEKERKRGRPVPSEIKIGAMLEAPSLAYAPDSFFELADFISIGGNDLRQFFFAADRQNEQVRGRYDTLNVSYLSFLQHVIDRCENSDTPLSYCGEAAGRPLEAVCLAAIGLRKLSMRAASIGQVKHLLRRIELAPVRDAIDGARARSSENARSAVADVLGPALYLNP